MLFFLLDFRGSQSGASPLSHGPLEILSSFYGYLSIPGFRIQCTIGSLLAGGARWPSIMKNYHTQNCFQHLHSKALTIRSLQESHATGKQITTVSGKSDNVTRHVPIVVTRILTLGFIAEFHPRHSFYCLYA